MTQQKVVALANLEERVNKLAEALKLRGPRGPIVPGIIIAHHVKAVVRAMFTYDPQPMANAMYADEICPTCVANLTNASQETHLAREDAITILEEVVNGDLLETHLRARLAKASFGPEAEEILISLRKQREDTAHKRDYMNRRRRVPGSAYSAKR